MDTSTPQKDIPLRTLYPTLTERELTEAEDTLERYVALALRIYERIAADPEAYARFRALTALDGDPSIKVKGRTFTNDLPREP